jgi:hypothetical protein
MNPPADLRAMHGLAGDAGWGDELVLLALVALFAGFILRAWLRERGNRAR